MILFLYILFGMALYGIAAVITLKFVYWSDDVFCGDHIDDDEFLMAMTGIFWPIALPVFTVRVICHIIARQFEKLIGGDRTFQEWLRNE